MQILYCGISSKYIHTMPAGWFLCEYLYSKGIIVEEAYFNTNQPLAEVLRFIKLKNPDTLLLSVYIFNAIFVNKLIKEVRQSLKGCRIVVGGPEVDESFDADHIIIGEGEEALYKLLSMKCKEKVIYQQGIQNLDIIPSPYTAQRLEQSENKLIYYESSRGCPFRCTYCMASLSKGVRYFGIDRVKLDLKRIVEKGAKVIKFTDRTFNANTQRVNEILTFILEEFYDKNVCFHFEVVGELFREETLELLKRMPLGRVQMEAGVQTLNYPSLKAINRVFKKETFIANIKKIISFGNIHMHLDLIAGLPLDTIKTFADSFNEVIVLRPHVLQLGFLKFLKGTELRRTYGAKFGKYPPYEIISSDTMSKQDLLTLKDIEFVVDRLYNSGKFVNTLDYLLENTRSPFSLFYALSDYFKSKGIKKGASESKLFSALVDYYIDTLPFIRDLLRFDYLITNNSKRLYPSIKNDYTGECKKFLAQHKRTRFVMYECFGYDPITKKEGMCFIKFDYSKRHPVTKQYTYEFV